MRRHSEPQCKDSNKTKTNDLLHLFLCTGVSMGKIMAELSQGDMLFKASVCSTYSVPHRQLMRAHCPSPGLQHLSRPYTAFVTGLDSYPCAILAPLIKSVFLLLREVCGPHFQVCGVYGSPDFASRVRLRRASCSPVLQVHVWGRHTFSAFSQRLTRSFVPCEHLYCPLLELAVPTRLACPCLQSTGMKVTCHPAHPYASDFFPPACLWAHL